MADGFDTAIVGAGVVGCAIAMELAGRGQSVLVLEREAVEGAGVTSRNSGVIHAGLYYPPGSCKARTCLRGLELLYRWADRHQVPHRRCGKLVIARTAEEEASLHDLMDNATRSGARELALWGPEQVRTREPDLPPVRLALWSARTGIVDAHALTRSLRVRAEEHDAIFAMQGELVDVDATGSGFRLKTSRGPVECDTLINSAGLHADEVAAMVGVTDHPVYPCRGDYFRLRTNRRYQTLIYPVRPPSYVGLGVHLTLELDGSIRLGPDAEFVQHKDRFPPAEQKHAMFLEATRRLLGPVEPDHLTYDGCGLRPTLRAPDSPHNTDFLVLERPARCIHLLGIESPGLTAALALAEEVAGLVT